jgi:hypothetical protein
MAKYFLTTTAIIDIWDVTLGSRVSQKVQTEKEVVTEYTRFWINFFRTEGGDYEGVQSFS